MNVIHPSAVIDEAAILGQDNYIGPYCYIGPGVSIGSNNRFEAYVSLGTPAEHRDYFHKTPGKVSIGSGNVIREFVTINGGTTESTTVGDNNIFLRGTHLGHDVIVENRCNFSCNVLIGGSTIVCEGANLGLSAVVHQHRVIGAFSMIGMNSSVTRNTIPFVVAFGSPCTPQKINRVGLLRGGVSEEDIVIFEKWYYSLAGLYEKWPSLNHEFNKYLDSYGEKKTHLYQILGMG